MRGVRTGAGAAVLAQSGLVMPTTCGFPNCKFRSRYRGHHDNRHFYRVPKKPAPLRERWLQAIGRTEGTIVNQVASLLVVPRGEIVMQEHRHLSVTSKRCINVEIWL